MNYTIDYFIEKFSAIPEEGFTTGVFENDLGQHCALGHCGIDNFTISNEECDSLTELFKDVPIINSKNEMYHVININDNSQGHYLELGDTPKQRILNKLKQIKECTH